MHPYPVRMNLIERLSARSAIRLAAVACVVAIAILSLTPTEHMVRTSLGGHTEHFLAYAIWGWLCAVTCGVRRHQFAIFALIAAYAGLLEFLQRMVPGRHSGVDDFFFSAAGAALGTAIALVTARFLK
jgi:VanZ family protein